jgi:hypothetical protein
MTSSPTRSRASECVLDTPSTSAHHDVQDSFASITYRVRLFGSASLASDTVAKLFRIRVLSRSAESSVIFPTSRQSDDAVDGNATMHASRRGYLPANNSGSKQFGPTEQTDLLWLVRCQISLSSNRQIAYPLPVAW